MSVKFNVFDYLEMNPNEIKNKGVIVDSLMQTEEELVKESDKDWGNLLQFTTLEPIDSSDGETSEFRVSDIELNSSLEQPRIESNKGDVEDGPVTQEANIYNPLSEDGNEEVSEESPSVQEEGEEKDELIPSPSYNSIDVHRYAYTYHSDRVGNTKEKRNISERTMKSIQDFLSKNHQTLFQEAIVDPLKRKALSVKISEFISSEKIVEPGYTADELIKVTVDTLAGLNVLEDLLENDNITDINVNGKNRIYVDELGKGYYLTDLKFANDDVLRGVCTKIVNAAGETLNVAKPFTDCRFPGMRINITAPEITGNGYAISIRKFAKTVRIDEKSMIASNQANEDMVKALMAFVKGKMNILIAGSTGSGKTELIKYLVKHVPNNQRLIMMEDTPETRLNEIYPEKHILMMECRNTGEEETSVDYLKLLRNALRQNPDRIAVGECRGAEADQMMKIFNTGHEGGMTTIHANSAVESVDRLINMVMEAGLRLDPDIIGKRVTNTFDIVIFQKKMEDGGRRIREIVELVGYENNKPIYNTLFKLKRDEFIRDSDGSVKSIKCHHEQLGYLQTKTVEKLLEAGIELALFETLINPEDKEELGLA